MSKSLILGTALTAAALAWAGGASGAVTVLGGGMAKECSEYALAGETHQKFEEVCTLAIQTEAMNARDRAGTYVNRGVFKLRRGEWEQAKFDFDRAADIKPDLGEAYVNRGAAALGAKRHREALEFINKALELGVDEPEKAYFNRALAHEGLDDMKSAYLDYMKAVEISPKWEPPRQELTRFTVRRE